MAQLVQAEQDKRHQASLQGSSASRNAWWSAFKDAIVSAHYLEEHYYGF